MSSLNVNDQVLTAVPSRAKVPIWRLGSGFRPSAAEPGGYPALVNDLIAMRNKSKKQAGNTLGFLFFYSFNKPTSAEGLKASVEANLNAKNSLQMVSEALLDPLELSGRIPDF
ncbi:hypothetical protein PCASD_18815 [Puccinia coronata f. sp. avenae]|uniref:Uncharacterized protein n=1 Tax=Puccinia coronata f. sp. avenae TaxID=200324 RepID=A0A2N5T9P5_9BASI|nr:hypothetical protein PCASD_18815 [Puccinia coronata f. sp. avenae]